MTQTSIGFNGTVNDKMWARLARVGSTPCIERIGDLPITRVSGTRGIRIGLNPGDSAGNARSAIGGDGIVTSLDAAEVVTIPTPGQNGQWFLVVMNRVWANTPVTQFLVRNGPTTAATFGFAPPAAYPATFRSDPGTNSDVPVAWVWANTASTDVMIFPLLTVPEAVYPRQGSAVLRDALMASLTPVAPDPFAGWGLQAVAPLWLNTDNDVLQQYIGAYNSASNVNGTQGSTGWYPVSMQANPVRYTSEAALKAGATIAGVGFGALGYARDTQGLYYRREDGRTARLDAAPFYNVTGRGSLSPKTDGTLQTLSGTQASVKNGDDAIFTTRSDLVVIVKVSGWYEVELSVQWQFNVGSSNRYQSITVNDTEPAEPIADYRSAMGSNAATISGKLYVQAGQFIKPKAYQTSSADQTFAMRLSATLLLAVIE